MRNRAGWTLLAAALVACTAGFVVGADPADELARAQAEFERHNYRAALEAADRCLAGTPDAAMGGDARAVRGQCLLKLREWDAGVAELQALLAGDDRFAKKIDLHEALGEAGLQQYNLRHLAVIHFGKAADLYLTQGNKQAAAEALVRKAEGFVALDQWQLVPALGEQRPDDWREMRRLQRRYAVATLDEAIELAGDSETAAEALFLKAQLFQNQLRIEPEDIDVALRLFTELSEKWPHSQRAAEALYQTAQITESVKQDYVAALDMYRRITRDHAGTSWAQRAQANIERIIKPTLDIGGEGPTKPGDAAPIHFRCRNVPTILLRAYRIDLFELIRRFDRLHNFGDWLPTGDPVATWQVKLPDKGEHKAFNSGADGLEATALPVREPGAYYVYAMAPDGKVTSSTLVLVSGLAGLTKSARSAALVMAADADTGQPAANAEVLVQRHLGKNRYEYNEAKTDDAGRYRRIQQADERVRGIGDGFVLIRRGDHYAVCHSSSYWYWWGYGGRYRGYCFTERPVYRPDQVIHYKAILRGYREGEYENQPARKMTVAIHDPKGEVIEQRDLVTNADGSVSGDLRLPDGAALGMYGISLTVDGQQVDAGTGAQFRVEEYRKPEFEVTVKADQADYRIGDAVDVRIEARYYFGEPVVDATVKYTVHRSRYAPYFAYPTPWPWYFDDIGFGWGRGAGGMRVAPPGWPPWQPQQRDLVGSFEAVTDAEGVAVVSIKTEALESFPDADLRYDVEAEVTDASRRVITGSGQVKVTHQPFYVDVRPQRSVYQPGDTVRLEVEAKSPNDVPVPMRGTLRVYRLTRSISDENKDDPSADTYRLSDKVFERPITVGADGRGSVQWVADQEGPFRVVVVAENHRDTAVTGTCDLWIARQGGRFQHYAYRDLELVLDRPSYADGDTANVLINTRFESCYVLLTAEADDLFDDRLIFVKGGTQLVELPIQTRHVPNFNLTATILRDYKVYQDSLPVVVPPVDRFLTVAVEAPGEKFSPRQTVPLTVTTTDSAGKPAPAEVALMMVDASVYYIQPELREQIEKHFYGQKRPTLVRTSTSFDFGGSAFPMPREARMRERADYYSLSEAAAPMAADALKSVATPSVSMSSDLEFAQFATAEIRKEFPDTVLWAAHVATDDTGKASVEVTFPDTLTTWRVHAIAVDRDTRVGQTSSDLISRKDIIARLQAPRFLVEGDQPVLTVIAHNYLAEDKTVRVTLEASDEVEIGEARVEGQPVATAKAGQVDVTVPAGGEVAVDFAAWAKTVGRAKLTATTAADVDADAMQIDLPIIPYGADKFLAESGSIREADASQTATVAMTVPQQIAPDSPLMEIHLNPSIAAVMIDALPYLLDYPYGCTEQTMSRFLPAVVVRRTLQELGINLADVRAKIDAGGGPGVDRLPQRFRNNPVFNDAVMNDMIRAGVERLAELQQPDGGWGWWAGGMSNPYMTAYVVYGLTEAMRADVKIDAGMLQRGVEFLLKRVVSTEAASRYTWSADDDNVRTWMLYALATHDPSLLGRPDVREVLDRIYEDRDGLTDYSRAMLMIAMHRIGDTDRTGVLVENLYNTVVLDDQTGTASWGHASGYRYWYNNGLEATAMVLRALLKVAPDHEYVPKAVKWLVRNRKGSRWYNTKDTAFAVYALADYLVASGELQADMTIGVVIDGTIRRSFKVTPDNALTFDTRIIVASQNLQPGEHRVDLVRSGKGNLYYGVYLDYYTREDPIEAAGHEVYVTRQYARLIPKQVTRERQVWDPQQRKHITETYQAVDYDRVPLKDGEVLASGDLIEVQLTIDARNNFEYLIFEDPKPAGCEPVELHSGYQSGAGPCSNVELRDDKTAFFATYLPQGQHPLTYRLRCETPGKFHALPTRAEAMYSPFVRANGRSDELRIE